MSSQGAPYQFQFIPQHENILPIVMKRGTTLNTYFKNFGFSGRTLSWELKINLLFPRARPQPCHALSHFYAFDSQKLNRSQDQRTDSRQGTWFSRLGDACHAGSVLSTGWPSARLPLCPGLSEQPCSLLNTEPPCGTRAVLLPPTRHHSSRADS